MPEGVADGIAADRGDEADDDQQCDVEVPLRCEETRGEQEAVAGQKEADQQTRFGKDNREETEVSDRPNQAFDIDVGHACGAPLVLLADALGLNLATRGRSAVTPAEYRWRLTVRPDPIRHQPPKSARRRAE